MNYANLVGFYTEPAVNTFNEAAGNTSMVFEFTLVDEIKIGDVIEVTLGYTLTDIAEINITLNNVTHLASISSSVLSINFTGINGANLANQTVVTINLLDGKTLIFKFHNSCPEKSMHR